MWINGLKLKEMREKQCRSIAEVAVAADLTAQRISQIEREELSRLNTNIVKAMAKLLCCHVDDLKGGKS